MGAHQTDISTRSTPIERALLDAMFERYVDWREACSGVDQTYDHWRAAPRSERPGAFSAYAAALDLEESAGGRYAQAIASALHSKSR